MHAFVCFFILYMGRATDELYHGDIGTTGPHLYESFYDMNNEPVFLISGVSPPTFVQVCFLHYCTILIEFVVYRVAVKGNSFYIGQNYKVRSPSTYIYGVSIYLEISDFGHHRCKPGSGGNDKHYFHWDARCKNQTSPSPLYE